MQLSVVIPVYNEGEIIEETLLRLESSLKTPHEALLIYDMNNDTTILPVKKLQKKYKNIRLVKNAYGKGALNALKTGLEKAQGEAVCVMMADLTDDPKVIDQMYRLFQKNHGVVAASRYMKGGHQIGGPKFKQFLSRTAGISLHYLTGIATHDVTNSFKLYPREFLKKIKIESDGGFELGIELTVKAFINGYNISEVPTTWRYLSKESRFYLKKWLPKYLKWYLWAIRSKYHIAD